LNEQNQSPADEKTAIDQGRSDRTGPLLMMISSFLIFVITLIAFTPPPIALLLTYGLIVHELGHWITMAVLGMRPKGIYFLPFIGAVTITNPAKTLRDRFLSIIAGPAAGLLSTIPLIALYASGGEGAWARCACVLAALNLFQMIPIFPLDGGQLVQTLFESIRTKEMAKLVVLLTGGLGAIAYSLDLLFPFFAVTAVGTGTLLGRVFRKPPADDVPPLTGSDTFLGLFAYATLAGLLIEITFWGYRTALGPHTGMLS